MLGYLIGEGLVAIMLSVGGILLGIGIALDDSKLKTFSKMLLLNTLINGAILGSLVVAFSPGGFINGIMGSITSTVSSQYSCPSYMQYNNAICFSYQYLIGTSPINIGGSNYPTIFDSAFGMLASSSLLYSSLGILGSINLNLGIISFGVSSALKPIMTGLGYAIDLLSISLIGIETQGYLLNFISIVAVPIMLPVGIVLRTFYFTQRIGGAIMAISIGLFAIFPMTYVMDAMMVNSYGAMASAPALSQISSSANGAISSISSSASLYGNNQNHNFNAIISDVTTLVSGLVNQFQNIISQLEAFLAIVIIESIILPIFSLAITVISIREIARILGSEVSFGRLYYV